MATSRAQQFFEQFTAATNQYEWLAALPSQNLTEGHWFEAKGCSILPPVQVASLWSKALSAFANTGGGVLIWGLDARKVGGVDQVVTLSLHENAATLASRLVELLPHSSDPPITGVQIVPVVEPGTQRGFVFCYVPEGSAKPYRAESAGQNYYIRIGSSSVVIPRPLLRSLFFPHSRANLALRVCAVEGTPGQGFGIAVVLRNQGSTTVNDLFVIVSSTDYFGWFQAGGDFTLANTDIVIAPHLRNLQSTKRCHPGLEFLVGRMTLTSNFVVNITVFGQHLDPIQWRFRQNPTQLDQFIIDGPISTLDEFPTITT